MNKATSVILITSGVLIGTGLIVCGIGFAASGFSFKSNKNIVYEHKEEVITDQFSSINIIEISDDVTIVPSQGDEVRIEYYDSNALVHEIDVTGDTLNIEVKDAEGGRHWWNRINFGIVNEEEHETTLYLPEDDYEDLRINTISGTVDVPEGYTFEDLTVSTVSGRITSLAQTSGIVSATTTSGQIRLSCGDAFRMTLTSVSGNIEILETGINGDLEISTTSGEVTLNGVTAGHTNLSSVSGDMQLIDFETSSGVDINTVSGDVIGNLIGTYNFSVDTTSGDIVHPGSDSNGPRFDIDTVSGDVSLQ